MAYDLYPSVDPSYNFPPEVRTALATSSELRNTVIPMTTTLRNNLTAGEKWDGRLILNTTIDRLERWDAGLAGWQQIADVLDLAPYTAGLLQRPGRNRIMNGDFSVNQREFTSTTTSGTYGLDRWRLAVAASAGSVTYSVQTPAFGELPESARAYARVVSIGQAAVTDCVMFTQRIEYVRSLSGKTAVISFWAKAASGTPKIAIELEQIFGTGGSPSGTNSVYAGQVTLSTAWVRYSVSFAVPSIAGKTLGTGQDDQVSINLWTSAASNFDARTGSIGIQNNTIDFWGVQFEEGSVATPFEFEEYAENLRKCRRYFQRLAVVATAYAASAYTARAGVALPTELRTPPANLTLRSPVGVVNTTSGDYAISSIALSSIYSTTHVWMDFNVASGLPAGQGCLVINSVVDVSAEL